MSLLSKKMKMGYGSDDFFRKVTEVENTPSKVISAEEITRKAVKGANLPSEVQKSMGDLLAERLRMSKQNAKEAGELAQKLQKSAMPQQEDYVNMGTTVLSEQQKMTRGKRLG